MARVYFYTDELKDDFCITTNNINTKKIKESFKYIHRGKLFRFNSFWMYHFIVRPIAFILCKVKYRYKVYGKKNLKPNKNKGFFIYGNHVCILSDVFFPSLITGIRKTYVLASPDSVSLPGIAGLVMQLGGIPVPNSLSLYKRFTEAIETRYKERAKIMIYPEAHEWPYYTGVRPFVYQSFRYPASLNSPVYAISTTFHKRRGIHFTSRPALHYHISEPFYPEPNLNEKENAKMLRDKVYDFLVEKSKLNEVEYIKYVKVEER